MARPQKYSDDELIDKLHTHLVTNRGSVYSMHNPTWQAYLKRMKTNPEFALLVNNCTAEGFYAWEKYGIDALDGKIENFNTGLYKHFTQNKKPWLSHEVLELDERIKDLEDAQQIKES